VAGAINARELEAASARASPPLVQVAPAEELGALDAALEARLARLGQPTSSSRGREHRGMARRRGDRRDRRNQLQTGLFGVRQRIPRLARR
jgi:hypothetical protein